MNIDTKYLCKHAARVLATVDGMLKAMLEASRQDCSYFCHVIKNVELERNNLAGEIRDIIADLKRIGEKGGDNE